MHTNIVRQCLPTDYLWSAFTYLSIYLLGCLRHVASRLRSRKRKLKESIIFRSTLRKLIRSWKMYFHSFFMKLKTNCSHAINRKRFSCTPTGFSKPLLSFSSSPRQHHLLSITRVDPVTETHQASTYTRVSGSRREAGCA